MANFWEWESIESKQSRDASDFEKIARKRAQEKDAELFDRQANSILDNLYSAAERGMGALDSLRSSATEQVGAFGGWAQERLSDVGTGIVEAASTVNGGRELQSGRQNYNLPVAIAETTPSVDDDPVSKTLAMLGQGASDLSQRATSTLNTAGAALDDPVQKTMDLLGGAGEAIGGAYEKSDEFRKSIQPDQVGGPLKAVGDALYEPTKAFLPGLTEEGRQDFVTQQERGSELMARNLRGDTLTPDEDEQLVTDVMRTGNMIGLTGPVKNYSPADEKIAGAITPPVQAAGSVVRDLPDMIVRQLFDNAVPLRRVGEAVEQLRGSKLAFDEDAYKLLRLARGSAAAADQHIEDALGPVVKGIDDQTLWDLNKYLKAKDIIDKDAVSPGHNFGGATVADAQASLAAMGQALGPKKMAELDQKAQQVWQFGHDLLKRKMDAGLIDHALYQDLVTKFPHYSPIRIIDWIDDEMARGATGMGSQNRLSVLSTGLKELTEKGTDRAAETPLDAYVRLAHETYRRSMMNESAAAMINHLGELAADPTWAKLMTPASEDAAKLMGLTKAAVHPRAPEQVPFSAFVNGQKFDFWLDKNLEQAINFAVPNLEKNLATRLLLDIPAKILRSGATSANALFLIPNVIGDTMTYLTRAGGLAALPETLPSLAKGWKSALTKDAAYSELRRTGGGYAGFFGAEAGAGGKTINDLRGLNNVVKATLGVIPRAGERVESATRLAEYHRLLAKGASLQEAALGARDVTIDFARGGEFTKWANAFIPFFNVSFQAPAQVARLLQNPTTRPRALTGVMSMVVAPTVGLELYNRQDPTYADVPKYDKDRGLVMMSPWGPGPVSPETGRPTPRYFLIGLREWSPFAIAVREAMGAALGDDKDAWDVARRAITSASPIEPSSRLVGDVLPPLPKQAIEQLTNYDTFRDRPIVPEGLSRLPNEQQYTSETSEVAKLAGKLTGQSPMRIQHAVTGLGAGVGRQALATGDLALKAAGVTPEPSRRIQQLERDLAKSGLSEDKRVMLQHELDVERAKELTRSSSIRSTPFVGGLAGTVLREGGGELDRQSAKSVDERLRQLQSDKDPRGKELKRLGITFSDVDNKIGERQLSRLDAATYRTKALDYREALLAEVMASRAYTSADDATKTRLVRNAMTRAAAWASQDVLPGANESGREFLTVARGDIGSAVDGYVKAVSAQQEIDALKETRYMGFSGDDAQEIATDRALLSNLRNVTGSQAAGDSAFISRYGARRYARAKYARVNPAYTAKVDQIERSSPELMQFLRANPIVREMPEALAV